MTDPDYRYRPKPAFNPFTYRPNEPSADADQDGEVADWENNWLSNFFAWASIVFVPTWCQSETDAASRIANYLWTSCPCCMLFRGIALGFVISGALWVLLMLVVLAVIVS